MRTNSRVEGEIERLQSYNPFDTIDKAELDDVIGKFITLVWLIKDKKLTKTTFFISIMENDTLREIFKDICGFDSDVELYRELLIRYPAISESKFIKNRIEQLIMK